MAAKKKKAPPSAEAIRTKALADPNTAKIADQLGVPLEDYVQQVVHFVLNPDAEPQLYVASDADLRKAGFEPPDGNAVGRYLVEAATVADAAGATAYAGGPKKKLVTMSDASALPTVGKEHTDAKLKAELDRQLRGKRGGKR